jgi:ATP-dependent DNA ligase
LRFAPAGNVAGVSAAAKYSAPERLQELLAKCERELRSGALSTQTLGLIRDTERRIVECLDSQRVAAPRKKSASQIGPCDLMLPRAARAPFDRPGWIFEMKYEGLRVLGARESASARLLSCGGANLASAFPEITECLLRLPEVVLDGELVVLDSQGKAELDKVYARSRAGTPASIEKAMDRGLADLLVFDILELRGKDLRPLPLLTRKRLLQNTLEGFQRIRPMQYVHERGEWLFAAARDLDIGGIVAKRADSPYTAGKTGDWLAIERAPAAGSAGTKRRQAPISPQR